MSLLSVMGTTPATYGNLIHTISYGLLLTPLLLHFPKHEFVLRMFTMWVYDTELVKSSVGVMNDKLLLGNYFCVNAKIFKSELPWAAV